MSNEQYRRRATDASNGDWGERLARLEERMGPVEEGVANFRAFTGTMTKFTEDARAEFREIKFRDDTKMKLQEGIAEALTQKEDAEAKRVAARDAIANKWWQRIAWIAAIGASMATASNIEAPAIRHFLHTHGFTFVQDSAADAPPKDQSSLPQSAESFILRGDQ